MNDSDRLQLQKMIKANNVEDQTDMIRQLKHSHLLQEDINALLSLKVKYRANLDKINDEAPIKCSFLFTYYTDLYNKIKKDEIDLKILNQFLNVLRRIEDGELDQHEGAFLVGTILKELYVDSALKKADKINAEHEHKEVKEVKEVKREPIQVSWKQYKSNL